MATSSFFRLIKLSPQHQQRHTQVILNSTISLTPQFPSMFLGLKPSQTPENSTMIETENFKKKKLAFFEDSDESKIIKY